MLAPLSTTNWFLSTGKHLKKKTVTVVVNCHLISSRLFRRERELRAIIRGWLTLGSTRLLVEKFTYVCWLNSISSMCFLNALWVVVVTLLGRWTGTSATIKSISIFSLDRCQLRFWFNSGRRFNERSIYVKIKKAFQLEMIQQIYIEFKFRRSIFCGF